MATHTLKTPMPVGDLKNSITVDKLDLVSISINFQPVRDAKGFWNDRTVVSCMLRHPSTDWIHTVTLGPHTQKGAEADALWADIKKAFPDFEKTILAMLAEHLPEGTIA